ncbi:MAG: hypothetical protein EZS28_036746, partial [Streblomastix strix]
MKIVRYLKWMAIYTNEYFFKLSLESFHILAECEQNHDLILEHLCCFPLYLFEKHDLLLEEEFLTGVNKILEVEKNKIKPDNLINFLKLIINLFKYGILETKAKVMKQIPVSRLEILSNNSDSGVSQYAKQALDYFRQFDEEKEKLEMETLQPMEGYHGRQLTNFSFPLQAAIQIAQRNPPDYECNIIFFTSQDCCICFGNEIVELNRMNIWIEAIGFLNADQTTLDILVRNGGHYSIAGTMEEVHNLFTQLAQKVFQQCDSQKSISPPPQSQPQLPISIPEYEITDVLILHIEKHHYLNCLKESQGDQQ